jgi:hypothetical protein
MESFISKLSELELICKRIHDLKKGLAEAEGHFELQLNNTKQSMKQIVEEIGNENLEACKLMIHEEIWTKKLDIRTLQELQVLLERLRMVFF